jgi:hypothetical protein
MFKHLPIHRGLGKAVVNGIIFCEGVAEDGMIMQVSLEQS